MANNFLTNLSELTDVDNKLLRTAFHLFIKPRQVLEDKTGHYSSSLRYALTLIGGLLFLIILADSIFYEEGYANYWRVPLRLQEHLELRSDIEDDFSSVILMVGVIPAFWLLNKLLFYEKRSLSYFFNLSLYLLTQITIISVIFYFMSLLFESELSLLFVAVNTIYFFYFTVSIKIDRWYLSIAKFVISSVVGLVSFNFISPYVHNFLTILFNYPDKEYSIELTDKSIFISVKEQYTDFKAYADIISAGSKSFYFIDNYQYGVGLFDFETNESWHQEIIKNDEYQKVISLLVSQENDILVVTGESENQLEGNKFIKLYSKTGEELIDFNLDNDVLLLDIQLIESREGLFDLLIPSQKNGQNSYEYKKMHFSKNNNQWGHIIENYLNLSLPLSSITTIDNHIKVGAVVAKPDIHYAYFGIVRYDSA
ncbi:hypothetical protein [Fulvivirga sp.]|uniref:hypothetical protein n=1 Tax=Fulvivirga sp. TaxID=1931237 RepID=UPI0032EB8373